MSRSESNARRSKYSSVRDMVNKRAAGFTAPYLSVPEGVQMFKPKAGVMLLDILPFVAGAGNPWAEEGMLHWERTFFVHRGVGANSDSFLCPRKTRKEPCPICEYRARLDKENDDATEDLRKSLMPKERQLFYVINRKEPDKGPQLWDFSFHLFGKLLQARIRDADEDDGWDLFFSLEKGLTLKVGFLEQTYGGRSYFEAETIDFKPRPEPYDEDIIKDLVSLDDVLVETSYDNLKKQFLQSSEDEPAPRNGGKKRPADDDEDDEPKAKKRHVDDDEPEEREERTARTARSDDDDVDEAPRSKKRPVDDDDEEPAPKSKKPAADDDWGDFDDDAPKGKSKKPAADEDDEEPAPKSKKRPVDDDEEPAPKGKKKPADDDWSDLDEEPKGKSKKPTADDDEDEAPRSKKRPVDDEDEEPKGKKSRFARSDDEDPWDHSDDEGTKKKGKR